MQEQNNYQEIQQLKKDMQFIAAAFTTYFKFPFGHIDYHMVAEDLKELTGAAYVVFNIIDDSGEYTITKAIAGVHDHIKKASKLLGFSLIDRKWKFEPVSSNLIQNRYLAEMGDILDVTKHTSLSRSMIRLLQKTFSISNVYGISIQHEGKPLGNFFLLMTKDVPSISDADAVELFATQTGTLMLRKQAEQDFEQLSREYETVFRTTQDAIMLIEVTNQREFTCLRINQAYEQILGISSAEAAGKTPKELFGEERGKFLTDQYTSCFYNKGPVTFEQNLGRKKQGIILHTVVTPVFKDGRIVHLVSSSRDITEQKRKEEQIVHMSIHDSLSGLYNRTYYQQMLQELNTPKRLPLSVIMADINGLKLVNDAFGHGKGDVLITRAAQVMQKQLQQGELAFRIGGDEFAVLLPGCPAETAAHRAEEIRKAAQAAKIDSLNISLAIGYHTKFRQGEQLEAVTQQAESMMYAHKLHESKRYRSQTIKLLMNTLEERTMKGAEHLSFIRRIAKELGVSFGLSSHELEKLDLLARYYDIGKSSVPAEILQKPGRLTKDEWIIMRRHCEVGYRIANTLPELSEIAEWILTHHEWYNGSGYPQGLKGDEIPLQAKIIAVCEAFAVMTFGSVYKQSVSVQEAREELIRCSGTQFDPAVTEALTSLFSSRPELTVLPGKSGNFRD